VTKMKRSKPDLTIIIPAYDEEECIHEAISETFKTLTRTNIKSELIVVDDGSKDRTLAICKSFQKNFQKNFQRKFNFKIIRLKKNNGYSKALEVGFLAASGEYITYIDADLQYPPSEILKLYAEAVKHDAEFVLGSATNKGYGFLRKSVSRIYNALVNLLFGTDVRDVHCKRVFKRSLIDIDRISVLYGLIDLQLLLLAIREKTVIRQVPIKINPRKCGKSKFNLKLIVLTLINLFRLKKAFPK